MTLEEARRKIGEELALARALADPSREDAQYHKGRRDGLMLAKRILAKVGDSVLDGPRAELDELFRRASRRAKETWNPEGRIRASGEAWAYMKARDLIRSAEEDKEEET